MGSINRVQLLGNLGRDAEVKTTPSGATVANFSVATTETWKDKNGDKQEKTEWSRCTLWGKSAEAIGDYLVKGKQVFVEGSLDTRQWEKDGQKHYTTEIKVSRVTLLGGGARDDGARQPSPASQPASRPDDSYGRAEPSWDDSDIPF